METADTEVKPGAVARAAGVVRAIWRLARLAAVAGKWSARIMLDRRHRVDRAARARWLRATCAEALRVCDVQVTSTGTPPSHAVIVPNHLGYLDVLALVALTPTVFVAKSEIASWPVFGWFARAAGTCFIDRKSRADVVRVGDELMKVRAAGVNVVVFLEGTSSNGRGLLPFKSSLLEPVARNGLRVAPAAIAFAVPRGYSSADEVCWWGDRTLPPHLFNLVSIPQVGVRVVWGDMMAATGERKELAVSLRSKVAALHERVNRTTTSVDGLAVRPPLVTESAGAPAGLAISGATRADDAGPAAISPCR